MKVTKRYVREHFEKLYSEFKQRENDETRLVESILNMISYTKLSLI